MKFLFFTIVLLLALSFSSASVPTLPELLTSSPKFSILVELVKFTDLLDTLTNAKDITIFAPTNFGFKRTAAAAGCPTDTPKQIVDCIKFIDGKQYVAEILKYHVVPGILNSDKVLKRSKFSTLNGQSFTRKGLLLIDNGPKVVNPFLIKDLLNLKYNNGIAHGINAVLLPVPNIKSPGLAEVATSANKFNILLALLKRTRLTGVAAGTPYLTIFAPTDFAFRQTAKEIGCTGVSGATSVVNCIVNAVGLKATATILAYHLVPGIITSDRVLKTNELKSSINIPIYRRGAVLVDQAPALTSPKLIKGLLDVKFNYGVVHGISRVLVPFNTGAGGACDQFEFPLSLKDGSFVPVFKLINAVRKCMAVRKAVQNCGLKNNEICKVRRGARIVRVKNEQISVGKIVAASKKCNSVAKAIKRCKI